MPSSLGPAEILVIVVVALIVLGPNKLPQAGRQVGRALAELRKWTTDVKAEVQTAFDVESALAEKAPSYDDYPDRAAVSPAAKVQPDTEPDTDLTPDPDPEPQPDAPTRVDLSKPAKASTEPEPTVDERL